MKLCDQNLETFSFHSYRYKTSLRNKCLARYLFRGYVAKIFIPSWFWKISLKVRLAIQPAEKSIHMVPNFEMVKFLCLYDWLLPAKCLKNNHKTEKKLNFKHHGTQEQQSHNLFITAWSFLQNNCCEKIFCWSNRHYVYTHARSFLLVNIRTDLHHRHLESSCNC